MFRKPKFDELEEKYAKGLDVIEGKHSFKITLMRIKPAPTSILEYDWKVLLNDGTEFNVSMGSDSLSFPRTRLERIVESLKNVSKYENDYLANAINCKIDEVYRKYK